VLDGLRAHLRVAPVPLAQWQRLVPTSWAVILLAIKDMGMYLTFQTPPPGTPYGPSPFNPLQQLTYFGLVFVLSPFMILTGIAQSPSILGRFLWYDRVFGNRQAARSLHFLGMFGILGFLVVHIIMVVWHGFAREMDRMVLGHELSGSKWWLGAAIGLAIIAAVVAFHAFGNLVSEHYKRATHRALSALVETVREGVMHRLHSLQEYPEWMIAPYFRLSGYPPISAYPQARGDDPTFERLLSGAFADFRLEVRGMVEYPLSLSLEDLRAMHRQEQTTLHHCIQGWSSIGRWGRVPLSQLLERCRPLPGARYMVFHAFGKHEKTGKTFYECVSLGIATHPQAILAYTLNGQPLPIQQGAPLRVRFETKLGFKMVKFVRSIELVDSYRHIGGGMGGVREDEQQFDMGAEI
jgi:thiosulfate reductase cytochrome b subunit